MCNTSLVFIFNINLFTVRVRQSFKRVWGHVKNPHRVPQVCRLKTLLMIFTLYKILFSFDIVVFKDIWYVPNYFLLLLPHAQILTQRSK